MLYCSTCLYPAPCGRHEEEQDRITSAQIDWMCSHQYRWFGQKVLNGRQLSYVYVCENCADEQEVPAAQLGNRRNAQPKKG